MNGFSVEARHMGVNSESATYGGAMDGKERGTERSEGRKGARGRGGAFGFFPSTVHKQREKNEPRYESSSSFPGVPDFEFSGYDLPTLISS